jgi:Zn-dependent protease with chaperone function
VRSLLGNYAESAVLDLVLTLPLFVALHGRRPWLLAGAVLVATNVVGRVLVPIVLLARRTAPLADATALGRIERALERAELRHHQVLVVDMRTSRTLGAWVQGFPSRRVLLSQKLAERPAAEIEAAVAHEAAHLRRHHAAIGMLGNAATSALLVVAIRLATTGPLLASFHATSYRDPAAYPLIALVLLLAGKPLSLLGEWHSRACERQADLDAVRWASEPLALVPLLKDLALDRGWHDQEADGIDYLLLSHPTAAERMELIERWYADERRAREPLTDPR